MTTTTPARTLDPLVDIGANLTHQKLASNVDSIIKKARDAGLTRIMVPGRNKESTEGASKLVGKYPEFLRYTAGVHPEDADDYKETDSLNFLIPHLSQQKCVAIGECGLDFNKNDILPSVQETVFERQLMIACGFYRPLFLIESGAFKKMVEMLEKYRSRLPPTVIRRFTGTRKEAKKYTEMGLYIGVTGFVNEAAAEGENGLRRALRDGTIPLNRLLLETDAPYVYSDTVTHDKLAFYDTDYPCSLPALCKTVALLMMKNASEVAKQTTENARLVYSL